MASGGKKKTTMAKLNRENRLRERRAEKQAKKDARKLASVEGKDSQERGGGGVAPGRPESHAGDPPASAGAVDPRAKEAVLNRLREASDETLAVFEGTLRDEAIQAGAGEQDIRDAQANHPEHG